MPRFNFLLSAELRRRLALFAALLDVKEAVLVRALLNATLPSPETLTLLTKAYLSDEDYIGITHITADFGIGRKQFFDSYMHKSQMEDNAPVKFSMSFEEREDEPKQ